VNNYGAIRLAVAITAALGTGIFLVLAFASESPGCAGEDRRILFGLTAALMAALGVGVIARHRTRRWFYAGGMFLLVFVPVWLSSLNLCAS
jgi:hypothetical protein